jgi:hypothetical protein
MTFQKFSEWVWVVCVWVFIAGKAMGTGLLAAWSWWWLLIPQVPITAWLLTSAGVTL